MPKTAKEVALLFIFSFLLHPVVMAWPIPDTGQTKCYNNTTEISCPQPGEPFYGQDAHYTINPPSYTKLDASGNDLPDDDVSWVMVRDNVTGLIWEVKQNKDDTPDDSNPHDADNEPYWDDFIQTLNDANFGGFSDWRIPTIKELLSIADIRVGNPAIDTDYFPSTVSADYWSSTQSTEGSAVWRVDFRKGGAFNDVVPDSTRRVRAVRGGQDRLSDHFIINPDGTITDTHTGLMWQKQDSASGMKWEDALFYSENLSLAGYNDWRLPSIKELGSIVDYSYYGPAIDTRYFPDTGLTTAGRWSSTTSASSSDKAWNVSFFDGEVDEYYGYKSNVPKVLAVRGGQNWLLDHLTILAPSQAARWDIGSEKIITWDTKGIPGDVKISLSRHGGKDWSFKRIVQSTENDGSYPWLVSGPASANCVLKVEPASDPSKVTSVGLFIIDEVNGYINAIPVTELQQYQLSFWIKSKLFENQEVETVWSLSDPTLANIQGNELNALGNGRVVLSTNYGDSEYKKIVYLKTGFDQMEMESNNTAASATRLFESKFMEGELLIDDIDYFQIVLYSDVVVEIGYFSQSQTADVLVEIYDSSDNLMASAASTDGESLLFPLGLTADIYYVKLSSTGDIDQNETYDLVYTTIGSLVESGVINIPMGESRADRINHLEDKRLFTFELAAEPENRQAVSIDFMPTSPTADYHIAVLNSNQEILQEFDSSEGSPVKIEVFLRAGTYSILVTPGQAIDAEEPFSIKITKNDYYSEVEPNNTYEMATPFAAGETIKGILSSLDDEDFYTIKVTAPVYLDLLFDCPECNKDYLISIYKDSDQNLINGIQVAYGETTTFPMGLGIGRYYLKVSGNGMDVDTDRLYTLSLNTSGHTNLEIESNNTAKFATPISKEDGRQGRIFSGDDIDYFGFNLPEMTVFHIGFSPLTATGDYKISLVDKDDQEFYYKTSSNGETMTLKANRPPGNYYVKVQTNGDVDQYSDYELVLTADADINPGHAIDGLKTLASISVSASTDELDSGEQVQLTATAVYSDTSTSPLEEDVLWSSLDPTVGSVDPNGILTGIGPGEITVVASYGGFVGQMKLTVGSPAEVYQQHYGSLILLAGGGVDASNTLKESTQYLSDLVYSRFRKRLFQHEDIYYFNPVSQHDIDGDGYDDNIVDDSSPTMSKLGQAITGWAAEQNTDGPLYICLIDHGRIDEFDIFPNETITASQLKGFIDTFQSMTNRRVIVIIEACQSGSFTDNIVTPGDNRIIVTSADDQDSYMHLEGRISFTQFFIDQLRAGDSIYQSYLKAKNKLSYVGIPYSLMQPQLSEGVSMASAQTWLTGDFAIAGGDPIGDLVGRVVDTNGQGIYGVVVTSDIGNAFTTTTSDGYFILTIPTGTHTITVEAEGYETQIHSGVLLSSGNYTTLGFTMSEGDAQTVKPGDINGYNNVDLEDAILALQVLSGLNPTSIRSDYASSGADINNNGKIGLEEVIYILQSVSGLR